MDCVVHGIARSQTRLSDFQFTMCAHARTHTHTHTAVFFLFTHALIVTLSVTQAQNRVFASLNLKLW